MPPDSTQLFYCTAWYLAFLFSTTLHEASHALVALRLGDDTAARGGQVTLDPIPHIRREPVGMVVVPFLSYFLMGGWMIGWASAPYDPEWANRNPRRAAVMAVAGPAANLLLCLTAALVIRLGLWAGWFHAPDAITMTHMVAANPGGGYEKLRVFAGVLCSIFFSLNLLLFAFNLIPLPPLDGSSVPLLFLSHPAAEKYTAFAKSPGMAMVGLILAWQLFGPFASRLQDWAIGLLYPGIHYSPVASVLHGWAVQLLRPGIHYS
ncbi:MAG: site-2 protease family protein [Verrucomicrobiota bacterium]|jgi:Zn-dependent protease